MKMSYGVAVSAEIFMLSLISRRLHQGVEDVTSMWIRCDVM